MAQIDIKECTIKAFDGTLGTLTVESVPADSDLDFTAVSKHIGSDRISVILADPGSASATLGIVVDGRKITVNLATDATSVITSTAALVKAAIEGEAAANALVTVALETAGTGLVEAAVEDWLAGQNSISIKIGEGNLPFSEHMNRVFTRDRGILDTVKNDEDEPLDFSMDATWEWLASVGGGSAPTFEDCVKHRNDASTWLTTADDTCQPYCIDIELHNAPGCSAVEDEIHMFEEYYYETADHDLNDGTISTAGRCNRTEANVRRVLNADVG